MDTHYIIKAENGFVYPIQFATLKEAKQYLGNGKLKIFKREVVETEVVEVDSCGRSKQYLAAK